QLHARRIEMESGPGGPLRADPLDHHPARRFFPGRHQRRALRAALALQLPGHSMKKLLLALLLLPGARALACSVCGCGDPLVDASDSVPFAAPLRLALDFEYLTATAASDEIAGAEESLTQITVRPVIVYSPVEELNLVLSIPLVRKDWSLDGGGAGESATPVGVGDVE